MRWSRGVTKETKEERQLLACEKALPYYQNWHWKYAWWPKTIKDGCRVWLEYYQVRYPEAYIFPDPQGPHTCWMIQGLGYPFRVEYRDKEEACYE